VKKKGVMKMFKASVCTIVVLTAFLSAQAKTQVERKFRRAHNTRGNTNIVRVQPVDEAAWLWHPSAREYIFHGLFCQMRVKIW
jgi:hypothetical protein